MDIVSVDKASTYRIFTLGCKVNQQESVALAARFEAFGFSAAGKGEAADVCVINSCTVTGTADSKTRQRIRQARAGSPGGLVCVIGCLPEVDRGRVSAMPEVDLAIGSGEKERTAEIVLDALAAGRRGSGGEKGRSAGIVLETLASGRRGSGGTGNGGYAPDRDGASVPPGVTGVTGAAIEFGELPPPGKALGGEGRTRAFIKAEDGCDRFCAYCVIPYARGAVRSRPADDVLREAGALLAAGYRELVLTGINLALYGTDFCGWSASVDLYALVKGLCEIDAAREYRVRLGSLEPVVIDADAALRLASVPRVCPSFHLSLQSGCGRTLKMMGREYTPDEYRNIVKGLRGLDPCFSVTTDVIVGFPGETNADFEESLAFVKELEFAHVHVFKYSRRPGTRAAEMSGQITQDEKNRRSALMIAAAEEGSKCFTDRNKGRKHRTLILSADKAGGQIRGITDNGINVLLPKDAEGQAANTFTTVVF